jgi:hypothetical protein
MGVPPSAVLSSSTQDYRVGESTLAPYIEDDVMVSSSAGHAGACDAIVRTFDAESLLCKRKKLVPPTYGPVTALGYVLDGLDHSLSLAPDKMGHLVGVTRLVLHLGVISGLQLSRLVGKWVWACLVARLSLSVFSAVYTFQARAGSRLFSLWPSVRRELLTIVGLAPLLYTSLSDVWCPKVVATDASEQGSGVMSTLFSSQHDVDPVPYVTDPSRRWSTIVSSPWRKSEHINVLELRSLTTAVKWTLSQGHMDRQLLCISDSQVVVGAVSKGRSSSPQLLHRLRSLAAFVLVAGLRLHPKWVPSEDNPADAPSRSF